MIRAFRTEICPDKLEKQEFAKGFGTRRYIFNLGLDIYLEELNDSSKALSGFDLDNRINERRRKEPEKYGWIGDVNTMIKSEALKDLNLSAKEWRKALKRARKGEKLERGKPKFKSKKFTTQSFRIVNKNPGTFKVQSSYQFNFNWTREFGRITVRTAESLDFLRDVNIKSMTVISKAGRYFMSLVYEKTNRSSRKKGQGKVGIDLGISNPVTIYDGSKSEVFHLPKSLLEEERLYDHWNKKLSKKVYGSNNYKKTKRIVDQHSMRAAYIRKDFLNKVTTRLVETYDEILIDDFNFRSYSSFVNNARHAYRVAPSTFKLMLETKAEERGVKVHYVKPFTPTTQTCSSCNKVNETKVTLKDRTFKCSHCGHEMDRDLNSAINVYNIMIQS